AASSSGKQLGGVPGGSSQLPAVLCALPALLGN
ncbi:hypothetical protein CEXT_564631, partial [Caerostris extrusa]